jgi:alpha,alpha-trehalase
MMAPTYVPMEAGQVGLPFAQPMEQGRVEFNQLHHLMAGLKACGDQPAASAVLENWLSLGERYGCLPGSNEFHELGRAGLPRLSSWLVEECRINPDPDLPARAYQVVADDHRLSWSDRYFKQSPNGLNRFCDVDYSHDASLVESGGECNRTRFQGDPSLYNAVDLNAHLWRTETDLAQLATTLGKAEEAADWSAKAERRKEKMLELMWSPQEGRFYDYDLGHNRPSDCATLAQFSMLTAGVLDPVQDQDKVAALVRDLNHFFQPDQILPVWDLDSRQEASPSQVLDLAEALQDYGFEAQAQRLRGALRIRLATQTYDGLEDQAARARMNPTPADGPFVPVFSPQGQERLQHLAPALPLSPEQVGPLDRRLRQLHPSLLQPQVIQSLQEQGLSQAVYQLDGPPAAAAGLLSEQVQIGDLRCIFSTLQTQSLGSGAQLLSNGQDTLVMAQAGDHLVIGDRAYALADLPDSKNLRLPQDLFENFYLAGGNPALEKFFHHDRDWLGEIPTGPRCAVGSLMGREGWNRLFHFTEKNWSSLTIDPSVVAGGSAMPIFNRAAVPSLGIFKTQFNWDTLFMARGMQLQGQGPVVAGMADNLLSLLQENGRVPNAARSVYLNKSQPPILPGLVRMAHRIRAGQEGPERAQKWLKHAYQAMDSDYKNFWCQPGQRGLTQIDDQSVVLARWGGPNHKFAMDESGFDTTSRFDGKTLDLVPPDLNAFLFRYSQDMQAMAEQLGKPEEAAEWGRQAQLRKDSLIQFCWDERDGMFRDYRFQGENPGLQRQEDVLATAAGPIWAGLLDPQNPREKRMLERSLQALERFEKPHGLAATAEDYGHPEMQWNGPSGWAPLHLMAIEGAVQGGNYTQAARWTEKWLDTITSHQQEHGAILERYDMVEGGAPPVQKGRYEETQGEGPGFGWTNATIPWALVEVVGGARVGDQQLYIQPVIPPSLQGQPIALTFADPGGLGGCTMEHRYDGRAFHTQLRTQGDWQGLELITPPLPPGITPQGLPPGARLDTVEGPQGKVRYRVRWPAGSPVDAQLTFA